MSILRPQCSHCIYWVSEDTSDIAKSGHCHRYPPAVHVHPQSGMAIQRFPTTEHRHWCGEWNNDQGVLKAMLARTAAKSASQA